MVELHPISGLPLIQSGDSLADLVLDALAHSGVEVHDDDILVLAHKIVAKSEGRVVSLSSVQPSPEAEDVARRTDKDPRLIELILRESRQIVRLRPGLIIVEDRRGFICANAGIDRSNVEQGDEERYCLLPEDPDASAARARARVRERTGRSVGVIVNDSHGRAHRNGSVGVAIGLAGVPALSNRVGDPDLTGYILQHTEVAIADEIAAAASILMGPAAEGIPAVLVRGLHLHGTASARSLLREPERDLFR